MVVAFAGKISSSSDRDSAFVEICRKCLDHRMVSEAKVVTSFIGDLGLRDSLLKEIEPKEIEFSAG